MAGELRGRDRELAALTGCLHRALAGHPSVAVVVGDPGIGKTSLLRALAAEAARSGAAVRWARGIVTGAAPPYWLWRQLGDLPDAGEQDRFAYYESLYRHVSALGPVALLVDDLQWSDESSLAALAYFVRRCADQPVLLAASLRVDDASEGWRAAGADLLADASVTRVEVGGLTDDDARACLHSASGAPLPPEAVQEALALARGNPFFLTEIGRAWSGDGTRGVPRSVSDVLGRRLGRLSAAAQQFLLAAAVVGDEAEIAVVAHCLQLTTLACLPAVQEALEARLLEHGTTGAVRFTHGLIRSALLERMPLQRAVALHAAAAAAIEQLHAGALEAYLADLARHHAAAAITGEREAAVRWATRAAEAAASGSAYEEAARLYGLAIECGGTTLPDAQRARLLLRRAAAEVQAGRLERAQADCREAAAPARRLADPPLLAQLALALEAIGARTWDRDVRTWCEDALAAADPADAAVRARLTARLAECLVYEGDWDDALCLSEQALALAGDSSDDEAEIAALRARQLSCSGPEHGAERAVLAQRMTGLGRRLRRPAVEMWGHLWAIDAHWERAELPAITTELGLLRSCVEQLTSPLARWHLLVAESVVAQARGELDAALASAEQAAALMRTIDHPAGFGAFMAMLGAVGHHRGHHPMSLTPPQGPHAAEGEMRNELFAHLGPAFALADAGRTAEAEVLFRRPGPPASWRIPPFFLLPALYTASVAAIALGRADDVAFLRGRLEQCRGLHVVGGAGVGNYCGPVELVLGTLAAAAGDLEAAEADLRAAVQICADRGLPGFRVEAEVELAAVLSRQRRTAEAQRLLALARPVAERLGMAPFLARIRAATEAAAGPLTAREREVAALVAEGRTNREIAERLVLSERTAANHVQHVLTKLGFERRAEIAAWVRANEYSAG